MLIKNVSIYFIFFICNIYQSTYLTSGIRTLNKFLYYSRIEKYYEQHKHKKCSLDDGPNCYFTENNYIKHYITTKNEAKEEKLNHEWAKLYSKIPKNQYKKTLTNLINATREYKNSFSKFIDKQQNSQNELFQIMMTFNDFDSETKKKDIYLEEKLGQIFFNELVVAKIEGKLKLSYDTDISEENLKKNFIDYPSGTYGIIESELISISFMGKLFICNSLYIKSHDKLSKSEKIMLYGYLGDKMVYSYTFTDSKDRKERWIKVVFPSLISVDKLMLSGYYDIDNIYFTFPNVINIDSNEIYSMYNHKNSKILITNDEI